MKVNKTAPTFRELFLVKNYLESRETEKSLLCASISQVRAGSVEVSVAELWWEFALPFAAKRNLLCFCEE